MPPQGGTLLIISIIRLSKMAAGQSGGQPVLPAPRMVQQVFALARDLPDTREDDQITTGELCTLCEDISGYGSMDGAQWIGSLWSLYPKTYDGRQQLLISGISVRGSKTAEH